MSKAKRIDVSRRSFLAGAGLLGMGAVAGTGLLGCSPSASSEGSANASGDASSAGDAAATDSASDVWAIHELAEPSETISADVCIVGAGGTGTAAAIQAIDLGLKPVIIEREPGYGGSFVGTEGMTALETHFTEADGGVYFAGAYNPDEPYTVKNAVNTC